MSSIPPNWISSVVGGLSAQGKAAEAKSKESAEQARGDFAQRVRDAIETDDADSQVHTDAEGTGSQGRAFDEGDAPPPDAEPPGDDADEATDDGGLDLTA